MSITITGKVIPSGKTRCFPTPGPAPAGGGDIGVFAGGASTSGQTGPNFDTMDWITLTSLGNASDFGNLSIVKGSATTESNGVGDIGIYAGGYYGSYIQVNIIEKFTISSPANATLYGGILSAPKSQMGAVSNGSSDRCVFLGGWNWGDNINVMEYITVSGAGNATLYGELGEHFYYCSGLSNGVSDTGVCNFGRSNESGALNELWKITISSGSVASYFGALSVSRYTPAPASNDTNDRGTFSGGYNNRDIIDYITITSDGIADTFGTLPNSRVYPAGTSNGIGEVAVIAGGGSPLVDTIDYFFIDSLGAATDFGDLLTARMKTNGCSNGAG